LPRAKENRLDIEESEEHRDDVVTHRESFVRAGFGSMPHSYGRILSFPYFTGRRKRPRIERQHGKANGENEKDITGR